VLLVAVIPVVAIGIFFIFVYVYTYADSLTDAFGWSAFTRRIKFYDTLVVMFFK
jgi:hypothetical protein